MRSLRRVATAQNLFAFDIKCDAYLMRIADWLQLYPVFLSDWSFFVAVHWCKSDTSATALMPARSMAGRLRETDGQRAQHRGECRQGQNDNR